MEETKTPGKTSKPQNRNAGARGRGGKGGPRREREVREFDQKILDLARVTRVTGGGKRMRFRATVVIGDHKGRVGLGTAKGIDVAIAVEKAYTQAKRKIVTVPMKDETIPHMIQRKYGSAVVLMKPAPVGTGLKSGGAVRMVLELAGVPNAVSKILASKNKINIARATLKCLENLRRVN